LGSGAEGGGGGRGLARWCDGGMRGVKGGSEWVGGREVGVVGVGGDERHVWRHP